MKTQSQISLPRRRFVQGLALGAAGLGLGLNARQLLASQGHTGAPTLTGDTFHLTLGGTDVNITGKTRPATTINGSIPGPTLRWKEGDTITLKVTNLLPETSSIHWHGILLPFQMDGVPGLSFDGIAPGETFTYRFTVKQSGTYWYHSHSGFQEQTGIYGAIVIDPREAATHTEERYHADRDEVILLSDWSDEDPQHIYATLKKLSHYYNFNERTVFDTLSDFRNKGVIETLKDRHMWNSMRMSQSDLADVTGYTYTYLMNGQSPANNWTCRFKPGERIRLRFINASAMTFFDIRIPGLDMTVVAMDGQPVNPVDFHECRLGVAETLDVIVAPKADQAYTLFAQSIDRSGFVRGTLTPDAALSAAVPDMDAPPPLGHTEMGMGAINHQASGHHSIGHQSMSHGAMDHDGMKMGDMKHHGTSPARPVPFAVDSNNPDLPPRDSAIEHPASEFGPGVDMRAMAPGDMLTDPGIGLRDRPWKVLTYADMETLGSTPDNPIDSLQADREIVLHLTGNMDRYMWSFNGIKFADSVPLELFHHERVRITLVNDTMMTHPIHLHGLWSDLELGNGKLLRKHTITVKPGEKLSYLVRADALGRWAYHCHLLYHMEAGMFREVRVVDSSTTPSMPDTQTQGMHDTHGKDHGGHRS